MVCMQALATRKASLHLVELNQGTIAGEKHQLNAGSLVLSGCLPFLGVLL